MQFRNVIYNTVAGCVLTLGALMQSVSAADAWPTQPVQIIVPIDAGTIQDVLSRRLADKLSSKWNQPVIVINRPGAAGVVGTQAVSASKPDGYTIGLVSATFTGGLAVRSNLPYTRENFDGVVKIGRQNFVILGNSNAPFNNIRQMIAYAQTSPGKLDYATPGVGSYVHIAMEQLSLSQNLNIVHIPYKAIIQAAPDVVSGRVHLLITALSPVLETMVTKGELKIIGSVSDDVRFQNNPIQSLASVVPGTAANGYYALITPRGTPNYVIDKIQKDVAAVISDPEFQIEMTKLNVPPTLMMSSDFNRWLDADINRIKQTIKEANIRIE